MPDRPFNRILVLRLSALGDILHTLPAAAAIRRAWPGCRIGWVAERHTAFLLEGSGIADTVHVIDTRSPRRSGSMAAGSRNLLRALWDIRRQKYQASLDFQGLFKSAAIGALCGIPYRSGHAAPFRREPSSSLLITRPVSPAPSAVHVIEQNNALVEALGLDPRPWTFPLPPVPREEIEVRKIVEEMALGEFAVLHPGAGWPTKIWAPRRWAELARRLPSETGLTPLFTGGPGDVPLLEEIGSRMPGASFRQCQTSFLQLIPLFRRARLFVGGDTGPMQLACALQTPTVALFGPSTPRRNGPFAPEDISVHHPLPCSNCYFRRCPYKMECMNIEAGEVIQAIRDRLSRIRCASSTQTTARAEPAP